MKRVIIDTDAGVDDALAILMAFGQKDVKIEAFTTVSGNVGVDKTTANVLKNPGFGRAGTCRSMRAARTRWSAPPTTQPASTARTDWATPASRPPSANRRKRNTPRWR